MRMQPGIDKAPTQTLTVLSISPNNDDHLFLKSIVSRSNWTLLTANNLFTARTLLSQRHDISVALCECNLMPGSWTDILEHIKPLSHPASVIVTSRLADERLWAEALNLGAWDVLLKPFERREVLRSVNSAWQHWHNQIRLPSLALKEMAAAG